MNRAVIVAASVHVVVVLAFLIAVGVGGGTRLLLALAGGMAASFAWVFWLREHAAQQELARPPMALRDVSRAA